MKPPAFLLATDENYFPGVVALINSIKCHFPDGKIYLLHNLPPELAAVFEPFTYRQMTFDPFCWGHLEERVKHITKTSFAKFHPDFIEEEYYCYLDVDTIVNRRFDVEQPKTLTCQAVCKPVCQTDKYYETKNLIRSYILERNGVIEKEGPMTIFLDGAYFANRDWVVNELRPMMQKVSKEMPQGWPRWYDMGYFQGAIGLLGRPIKPFKIWQFLVSKDEDDYNDSDIIHFLSSGKPWLRSENESQYDTTRMWWKYLREGPVYYEMEIPWKLNYD